MLTENQKTELEKKLDPSNVKKHPFSKCDYIEGWHAIAEANRIFGFDGWSRETIYNKEVARYEYDIKYKGTGWKVGYEAKVSITIEGVTRTGTGHGSGTAKDLFDCIEGAAKEAETDAMKRALMTFGNQFGLALYDKKKENVGVDNIEPEHNQEKPKQSTPEEDIRTRLNSVLVKIEKTATPEEMREISVSEEVRKLWDELSEAQKDYYNGKFNTKMSSFQPMAAE